MSPLRKRVVQSTHTPFLLWLLLCLGLGFLPLVFIPTDGQPAEVQKVFYFQTFVEVLTILMIGVSVIDRMFRQSLEQRFKQLDKRILGCVVGLMLIALVSSIFGVNFTQSWSGNFYRSDGLSVLLHLGWCSFLLGILYRKEWEVWLWRMIAMGATASAAIAISHALSWYLGANPQWGFWGGAQGGLFIQPNYLTGYLLVTLPVIWYLKRIAVKGKWLWWLPIGLIVMALLATLARAAIVGMIFEVILIGVLTWRKTRVRLPQLLTVGVIAGILCLSGWLSWVYTHPPLAFAPESRSRLFIHLFEATSKRPLLGYGWSTVDIAFKESNWPLAVQHDVHFDKAHSVLLEYLVTTGILGLVVFVGLLLLVWKVLWRKKPSHPFVDLTLVLFLVYVFHSQTNVISIAEESLLWVVIGLATVKRTDDVQLKSRLHLQ